MHEEEKEYKQIHEFQSEEKIRKQIISEYEYGHDFVEKKAKQRVKDMRLYVEDKDNMSTRRHTIYTMCQTLMSVLYSGDMDIVFSGANGAVVETAKNLNRVARFDYREMGLSHEDYQYAFDQILKGVGVQIHDGFNTTTKCPIVRTIDPVSCIPDPDFTKFNISGHRFFGIKMKVTYEEMERQEWENIELVSKKNFLTDDDYRNYVDEYRGYGSRNESKEGLFDVYYHYTTLLHEGYEGKYLVVSANDRKTILSIKKLEPVMDEEKEDWNLIMFPINLRYFSPLPGDFFSVSLIDIVKNDQKYASELLNLILVKAKRSAMGNDMLVDENSAKDVIDVLKKPSQEGRIIPLKLEEGQSIRDVLYERVDNGQEGAVSQGLQLADDNSRLSTGLDFNSIGVASPAGNTLGEQKIVQQNANTRFLLMLKYAKWSEETRWFLWLRTYIENKGLIGKKIVHIVDPVNGVFSEIFKADDFITKEKIHIEIFFKSEKEAINQKKAQFVPLAGQLLANAQTATQKAIIMRKQLEIMGMEEKEVLRIVPYTKDELDARELLILLNEDDELGEEIEDMNADHQVYIDIFSEGKKTTANMRAIQKRRMALSYVNQSTPQIEDPSQQQNQNFANIGASQIAQQALSNNQNVGQLSR